jgi:hypothetical protein
LSIYLEIKASKRPLLSPLSISWDIEKNVAWERGATGEKWYYTELRDEQWELKRG